MKIEEVLHLFTKVSEGLPEEPFWYLCRVNDYTNYVDKNDNPIKEIAFQYLYYFKEPNVTGWENDPLYKTPKEVTHWLDLSKLTTKEIALKAIDKVKISYRDVDDGFMGTISEKYIDKQEAIKIINQF